MAKRAPKHFFSKYASVNKSRSLFDYSNTDTVAIGVDYLYPNYVDFVLPGDTWVMDYTNSILMVDPIKTPMRDNLYADSFWFFVPFRLNWQNTKYFFGEKDRSGEDIEYSIPQVSFTSSTLPTVNSIYDFMGIPIAGTDNILSGAFKINALPLRAYNLIWDEWFRDELRQDYSYYNIGDSDTASTNYTLLKRGKRFDYFTSTTLQPILTQSGQIDITIGESAPVYGDGNVMRLYGGDFATGINNGSLVYATSSPAHLTVRSISPTQNEVAGTSNTNTSYSLSNNSQLGLATKDQIPVVGGTPLSSGLYADLSSAEPISISTLQTAFQMQAYYYQLGIGGTRYREYLYSMYGVISPDARMQIPEFLGKTHQRIEVTPVIQNSETATTPQGTMTAILHSNHGESVFTRSFTEHGFLISLINIYADQTYYQGLDRFWSFLTPFDIPLPVFSNLIDEPVYRKEILLTGTAIDNTVYGYQERYAFAKVKKNTVRGLVRPNAPQTLGIWSLAQQFDNTLTNNADFIEQDTPIERITADTENNDPHFIINQKFNCKLTRELPLHSNPQLWMFGGY